MLKHIVIAKAALIETALENIALWYPDFETRRNIFPVRTSQPVNNIYIYINIQAFLSSIHYIILTLTLSIYLAE